MTKHDFLIPKTYNYLTSDNDENKKVCHKTKI